MAAPPRQAGNHQEYAGIFGALLNIPRREGVLALYKGFWPMFTRKIVWTVLFFMTYESLKSQGQQGD